MPCAGCPGIVNDIPYAVEGAICYSSVIAIVSEIPCKVIQGVPYTCSQLTAMYSSSRGVLCHSSVIAIVS